MEKVLLMGETDREEIFIQAKDAAVRFLGYRQRSRYEIEGKLEQSGFPFEIIEEVLSFLERCGYVNDAKFCEMFINDKYNLNGFGSERITAELLRLGVDKDVVSEALQSSGIDEEERAYKLLLVKFKRTAIPEEGGREFYDVKNKALAFLLRKGYSSEIAAAAFKRVCGDY